jgi:hypothetical protein
MIENCKKLDVPVRHFLTTSRTVSIQFFQSPEVAEFLVDYLCGFELLGICIGKGPVCHPVFSAEEQPDLQLPNRCSNTTNSECVCLGTGVSVIDLTTGDAQEYKVDRQPLAGYAFEDGSIGPFYEADGQVNFVTLNSDSAAPHEVSLRPATRLVISPRTIAFAESTHGFCAVVDLQSAADEGEQTQEPEEEWCFPSETGERYGSIRLPAHLVRVTADGPSNCSASRALPRSGPPGI